MGLKRVIATLILLAFAFAVVNYVAHPAPGSFLWQSLRACAASKENRHFDIEQRIGVVLGFELQEDGSPHPILRDRLDRAARLLEKGRIIDLILSGGKETRGNNTFYQCEEMEKYVISKLRSDSKGRVQQHLMKECASSRVTLPIYSHNTRENALFSVAKARQKMDSEKDAAFIVITSSFHQSRSWMAFQLAVKQTHRILQDPSDNSFTPLSAREAAIVRKLWPKHKAEVSGYRREEAAVVSAATIKENPVSVWAYHYWYARELGALLYYWIKGSTDRTLFNLFLVWMHWMPLLSGLWLLWCCWRS